MGKKKWKQEKKIRPGGGESRDGSHDRWQSRQENNYVGGGNGVDASISPPKDGDGFDARHVGVRSLPSAAPEVHCSVLVCSLLSPDQPQKFAHVHKVFGVANVTKMLHELPPPHREDCVNSLAYEADARVQDPVYGCVGAISVLQQQVAHLQAQLALATSEIARLRETFAIAAAASNTTSSLPASNAAPSGTSPFPAPLQPPGSPPQAADNSVSVVINRHAPASDSQRESLPQPLPQHPPDTSCDTSRPTSA